MGCNALRGSPAAVPDKGFDANEGAGPFAEKKEKAGCVSLPSATRLTWMKRTHANTRFIPERIIFPRGGAMGCLPHVADAAGARA